MNRLIRNVLSLSLGVLLLSACGTEAAPEKENSTESKATESNEGMEEQNYPQLSKEVQEDEILVNMQTNLGNIKIKLFPELAPKTVENFVTHSKDGYYDGLTFHRVINDFMLQGGDPTGNGTGGESIYGEPFEDEFTSQLFNLNGALSMANAGPNTNGSQFFIVQNSTVDSGLKADLEKAGYPAAIVNAYLENGGTPWLDSRHTVFGQVVEGMDVVNKIASVEVGAGDKPVEDVLIETIEVVE
ncbi:peptidylprolyl isomerase [Bacillus sp. 2205SS5-2]|uniref:peptidylprolyl isomerase n=1 Tax=Bacillus sp. 2205SS5-2 TaxID=3109031 RepID=UPI0030065A8F